MDIRCKLLLIAFTLVAASACGCAKAPVDDPEGDAPENTFHPLTLSTRQSAYVASGNAFSFRLLRQVEAGAEKDYVISPLSLQFLLGMILDGAQGETADEICSVLGYGDGETEAVNEYCLYLLRQLPALDRMTKLSIADAIVVDKGYALKKPYQQTVEHYYDAEVSNLDFNDREGSAEKINKWCSDHTNGLIPKILEEVSPDMLCYLINAIYFKSQWESKFIKSSTADEPFTTLAGKKATVPMMKQLHTFPYMANKYFQAVRLPYGNGAFSMTVILPRAGLTPADVTAYLQTEDGAGVLDRMNAVEVDLWLPRFETKYHILLNDILCDMGMPRAFDGRADFTPMSDDALFLSFVQQDAVIKVDEEGSEAAAVSSAGMFKTTSVGPAPSPVVFHAERPFLYLITESSSGAILFAGRYAGV